MLITIVDAPESRDREQRRRFALAEQVLHFVCAQRGVDGHENGADFRERELEDHPLGDVRRPHGYTIAPLYALRDQSPRQQTSFVVERTERPASPRLAVDESLVFGERVGKARQQGADRHVAKRRNARCRWSVPRIISHATDGHEIRTRPAHVRLGPSLAIDACDL
jgi:hypothetical protein